MRVRHGDFTVLSNKLVNFSDFKLDQNENKNIPKYIKGEDVQHIVVFIPTKGEPTLQGALDDAINKGSCDVMTDAVVHSWGWYIPYIYGQAGWSVEGNVVKTRNQD